MQYRIEYHLPEWAVLDGWERLALLLRYWGYNETEIGNCLFAHQSDVDNPLQWRNSAHSLLLRARNKLAAARTSEAV